jgi:hypothetical protein
MSTDPLQNKNDENAIAVVDGALARTPIPYNPAFPLGHTRPRMSRSRRTQVGFRTIDPHRCITLAVADVARWRQRRSSRTLPHAPRAGTRHRFGMPGSESSIFTSRIRDTR